MRIDLASHKSLEQVRAFLESLGADGSEPLLPEREEQYGHIQRSLVRFGYRTLRRAERGLVLEYLRRTTGLSRSQVTKLVGRSQREAQLRDRRRPGRPFASKYTRADIAALAELDGEHGRLSGPATRKLCQRAWELYGDGRYERLAGISNGHVYNLRKTVAYRRRLASVEPTRPRQVAIGERRKPRPEGRPGFVRVDTVHQGDLDGVKGVYHINVVDEVTQYQAVGSVETISERHLLPVLEQLLAAFPFAILGFHSDNGSEYVNRRVAKLLEKLRAEFTKSRPRRSTDNALCEGKNGSVVRKHLGYGHIPGRFAEPLNRFNREVLTPYLNYHRPCLFASEREDPRTGRIRKRYRHGDVRTPYERLRDLPDAEQYLRPGVDFAQLDAQERALTDLEAARRLNAQRETLFRELRATA